MVDLQLRRDVAAAVPRHRDLQQGAEKFYGYGVNASLPHHPLLQLRSDHPSLPGKRVCAASGGVGVRGDCGE